LRINLKAVFPCAFTVGNLLSGFLAITATISHNLEIAAGFICLGAILDGLDGTLARALRGSSRFGREFDSLADFVTFGIAPMVMVYGYLSHTIGFGALVLTAVFIMAGAFRLIRHNLESHEAVHGYVGLPITSSGIALAGYVLINFQLFGSLALPGALIAMTMSLILLMVSRIHFPRLKVFSRSHPLWLKFLLSILFVLPLIIRPQIMIFVMIMGYIIIVLALEGSRYLSQGKFRAGVEDNKVYEDKR
jgi:CDP-diacylglycerol--serine O-phosphatidyltransferase